MRRRGEAGPLRPRGLAAERPGRRARELFLRLQISPVRERRRKVSGGAIGIAKLLGASVDEGWRESVGREGVDKISSAVLQGIFHEGRLIDREA